MTKEVTIDCISLDALRKTTGHKFNYGHALVLSGGAGRTGAARLAARGALRIGTGLVTVVCPPEASCEIASQITSIMLQPIADASALECVLTDDRINAVVVGPGFGLQDRELSLLKVVLASRRAAVLDADALTLLARNPDLFEMLHDFCVLTPHEGEFARLFPKFATPTGELTFKERLETLEQAVDLVRCCIVRKGAETLISAPREGSFVHRAYGSRAAPWLATAGSGDVLAGVIGGLLARGFVPFQAALHAAWLHTEAARYFGPGLIAEDLPDQLPSVLKRLLA